MKYEHVRIINIYIPYKFYSCMRTLLKLLIGISVTLFTFSLIVAAVYSQLPSDAEAGLKYFNGDVAFKNGGPACISCHSISALDVSGGSVGPDLSRVLEKGKFTNFGGDVTKLKEYLSSPTTPTMKGVWSAAPLTSEEINALASLLEYAFSQAPAGPSIKYGPPIYEFLFVTAAVAGLVVALLAYIFVLRRGG